MARRCSTLCLPIGKTDYQVLIDDPARFRAWLDQAFHAWPELFPKAFADGYRLKDLRTSGRTGLRPRRIRLKATGESFSIRPSFVLPYMAGLADDVQGPLFLRAFGVPFWALARVFGKGPCTGTAWKSVWDATVSLAPPCAGRTCPCICWPTSITRRGTGPRTTSPVQGHHCV